MLTGHVVAACGVSGDLLLGALLDAGAPLDVVRSAIDATGLHGLTLHVEQVRPYGVTATRVEVRVADGSRRVETWARAREVLESADLDDRVREPALAAYRRLGEAEAAAHGTTLERVRFHELGDPDTLADIVAVCAAVAGLGLDTLTCGPVALGGGRVQVHGGPVPVPPPAVVELLRGFEVTVGGDRELTTPTGAALLATLTRPTALTGALRLRGWGRGTVGSDPPSVLQVLVGETSEASAGVSGALIVEATVDDLAPQLVPVVLDRLREVGAHDAWAVPVLMKKGRPGTTLTALADPETLDDLVDVLVTESTTIGLRWHPVSKLALARRTATIDLDGRSVRVKVAEHAGRVVSAAPEFDDVRDLARDLHLPVGDVLARARAAAQVHLDAQHTTGER